MAIKPGDVVYRKQAHNLYWMHGTPKELADLIVNRITLFSKHGLGQIAEAINPTPQLGNSLQVLYNKNCSQEIRNKLKAVQYRRVNDKNLLQHVMTDPTLAIFHDAFRMEFGDGFKRILYGNYVSIALMRTRCAFKLSAFLIPDTDTNTEIARKWQTLRCNVHRFLT